MKKSYALLDSPMYLFSCVGIFENKHWLNKQKKSPLPKIVAFLRKIKPARFEPECELLLYNKKTK